MNDNPGYGNIPHAFFDFITFLTDALPLRSVPTFIELLIGAMLTQHGFVTHAWLATGTLKHWTTYYKWIEYGQWSWVNIARRLAAVVHGFGKASIPLLSRMMRNAGNSSKLDAAKVIIRTIAPEFANEKITLLTDSWYMRGTLIKYVMSYNFQVIGQVRKDTALYGIPKPTGKRGRPRIYGDKYTPERVSLMPATVRKIVLYGRRQEVSFKSTVARARFLKGQAVRAVWVRFIDDKKVYKEHLLLATDPSLSPVDVLTHYEKRWTIETMFNQVKNNWGWIETWQQSRQVLHRWIEILSMWYAIPQLLALQRGPEVDFLANFASWRAKQPITASRVRLGLQIILKHFRVRDWWNPKSRKLKPPEEAVHDGHETHSSSKAA